MKESKLTEDQLEALRVFRMSRVLFLENDEEFSKILQAALYPNRSSQEGPKVNSEDTLISA